MNASIDASVERLVRARRTVYEFRQEPPPTDVLVRALDAAVLAPNHKHTKPWRIYLLGPASTGKIVSRYMEIVREKRGEETARIKGRRWERTPAWFVVTCVRSDDPFRDREDYGACCCMVQNLALLLWSAGIGLKWSTGPVTRHEDFWDATGIDPDAESVVGLFGYGFPEEIPGGLRASARPFITERD